MDVFQEAQSDACAESIVSLARSLELGGDKVEVKRGAETWLVWEVLERAGKIVLILGPHRLEAEVVSVLLAS